MNKFLFLVSLSLVALAVLDTKHGVHSKSIQPSTVNPSEEKVVVGQSVLYYDFYLALQWPGTICKFSGQKKCTQPIPNKFTIHGLWPQNITAWPQENCCGTQLSKPEKCYYNDSSISPTLRPQLAMTWPDLFGNNVGFWDHEWTKHGACAVDEISQPNYFQKTNNLFNKHNFFQILQDAGIKADGSTYYVSSIKNAIWRVTGLSVVVKCRLNGNISYLQEIYVCVNKDATAFQCCEPSTTDKCKPQAVFPKI